MICSLQQRWPQAHPKHMGKGSKQKSTWWFLTETTLSMEGTNTHGLQICVKQYQRCSRAETGKSRCCPKQNLLENFNMHNTSQEIGALSCERGRAHCKLISSSHRWTERQRDRRGRIQSRSGTFTRAGWVSPCVQLPLERGASYRKEAWLEVKSYWTTSEQFCSASS